jgi:hypothetical protein
MLTIGQLCCFLLCHSGMQSSVARKILKGNHAIYFLPGAPVLVFLARFIRSLISLQPQRSNESQGEVK